MNLYEKIKNKLILIKEKIKNLIWLIFGLMSFIIWTIDYYLVYFGLSFFLYKFSSTYGPKKIVFFSLFIPIIFLIIYFFYKTTFFTSFLVLKNKFFYFILAVFYSLNRIISLIKYCLEKPPKITSAIIIELPCFINLFIITCQIILIFGMPSIFLKINHKKNG